MLGDSYYMSTGWNARPHPFRTAKGVAYLLLIPFHHNTTAASIKLRFLSKRTFRFAVNATTHPFPLQPHKYIRTKRVPERARVN
jgi:hypothetical protein